MEMEIELELESGNGGAARAELCGGRAPLRADNNDYNANNKSVNN